MNGIIRRELSFPQSREEVWRALTDPVSLAEWMYPNDIKAQVGHRFTFRVPAKPEAGFEGLVVECEVLNCVRPETLSFTWVAGGIDTRVSYRLEADGDSTKVFFEHAGFEQKPAFKGAEYGWRLMHDTLADRLSRESAR